MRRATQCSFNRSKVQSFKVLGFLILSGLELLNLERASAQQTPSYSGKTLKIIVGSSSGGGYDLWARLMAQHIGKHLPGHPTVIVQNMAGAGGVVAANYIYGIAKPDGLTIGGFNPALYFDQLVARPEVKFDWAKITWIGSPEKNDIIHFIRTDAPFKTIDNLRNAKEPPKCGNTADLVYGSSSLRVILYGSSIELNSQGVFARRSHREDRYQY